MYHLPAHNQTRSNQRRRNLYLVKNHVLLLMSVFFHLQRVCRGSENKNLVCLMYVSETPFS